MSESPQNPHSQLGVFALVGAFALWGVLVLYLRELAEISPLQIMACRLCFCCVFVSAWLCVRGDFGEVLAALSDPGTRLRLAATAALISGNWLLFTWAVTNNHVVEASLGYFINPLVNVLLGVLVLRERLRLLQWCAVALAMCAVAYLGWLAHAPPFIALMIALTFGAYGLLRKTVMVSALSGLAAETLLATPFGLAYLAYCEVYGPSVLQTASAGTLALLVGSGIVTAIPLWLFSFGARRLSYSTVGLLQYIAPSMQLALGVFVLGEPLQQARLGGFMLIWCACALYAFDGFWSSRREVPARAGR